MNTTERSAVADALLDVLKQRAPTATAGELVSIAAALAGKVIVSAVPAATDRGAAVKVFGNVMNAQLVLEAAGDTASMGRPVGRLRMEEEE